MNRRKFIAAVAVGASAIATTTAHAKTKSHRLYRLPGTSTLQMRRMGKPGGQSVLYIHGSTIPSALSVVYRFGLPPIKWRANLSSGCRFECFGFELDWAYIA
jgi:hypothetical protein